MDLSVAALQREFSNASSRQDDFAQQRPVVPVTQNVLAQVFSPFERVLARDAVYGQYDTVTYHHIHELRQACLEAFSKESNMDEFLRQSHSAFPSALQGIMEKMESAHNGVVMIDYEDMAVLYKNRKAIGDAASIHRHFMHNPDLAASMEQVVHNIEAAQKRNWMPDVAASNDEKYQLRA